MGKPPFLPKSQDRTDVELTNAPLRAQTPLLSIREAARKLGKSTSTVYRLDRVGGPFRFVLEGRRVFIDAESFEAYRMNTYENSVAIAIEDNLKVAPTEDTGMEPPQQPMTGNQGDHPAQVTEHYLATPPDAVQEEGPRAGVSELQHSGQRELILPPRRPFVMFYTW